MICVCCIMSCSEIFLSQDGVSQRSIGCIIFFSFHQPWWQPLVNSSLISPIWRKRHQLFIFWLTPCLCIPLSYWVTTMCKQVFPPISFLFFFHFLPGFVMIFFLFKNYLKTVINFWGQKKCVLTVNEEGLTRH